MLFKLAFGKVFNFDDCFAGHYSLISSRQILQDYVWCGTLYTLQPEKEIEKDMEHDEVLKCDVVRVSYPLTPIS